MAARWFSASASAAAITELRQIAQGGIREGELPDAAAQDPVRLVKIGVGSVIVLALLGLFLLRLVSGPSSPDAAGFHLISLAGLPLVAAGAA